MSWRWSPSLTQVWSWVTGQKLKHKQTEVQKNSQYVFVRVNQISQEGWECQTSLNFFLFFSYQTPKYNQECHFSECLFEIMRTTNCFLQRMQPPLPLSCNALTAGQADSSLNASSDANYFCCHWDGRSSRVFWSNDRPSLLHSAAMRKLWRTASVLGPAFGALLWSKKQAADSDPASDYELKLVQVLFRHGARTPLKSIPDVMEVRPFLSDWTVCAL